MAIAETGSFEAAARALHVTPSAVSQRVRALESVAGQVLVRRGTPCRPTAAGEALVRLGRQTRLLQAEAAEALGARATGSSCPVAVNADSLATWWRPVLAEVAELGRRRPAAGGRGPGLVGRPPAQRGVPGRGDQRPGGRAGLLGRGAGRAALPARGDPGAARAAPPSRSRRRGRRCRSWSSATRTSCSARCWPATASSGPPWCTGCRPARTSTRPCAPASGGGWSPTRSCGPDLADGRLALLWRDQRRRRPALAALAAGLDHPGPPHRRRATRGSRRAASDLRRHGLGRQHRHARTRSGARTPRGTGAAVVVQVLAGLPGQNAASSRSISDRSVALAMASSAVIFGRLVRAKNCAAATLPS